MQFSFDEDQLAMRDAVRALCADRFDLTAVAAREGKPADPATWRALADMGVFGILEMVGTDDPGSSIGTDDPGSSIGVVEAAILFEELGTHLASGPVLWSTLAASFADDAARVAGIEVSESTEGPFVVEHAEECDALVVLRPDRVELCRRSDLPRLEEGSPLDPLTPVSVLAELPTGEVVGDAAAAERMAQSGQVLAAAMLVGAAQGALDVARSYALEREQFGVPIGSFQAIKHMLADMFARVELGRAATYAAAAIAADPRAGDPARSAATAKLLAGEAGIANGRAAVQILGGMGFTWDMLPHLFLKRSWVLEHTFGTASSHAEHLGTALGEEVLAS